MDKTVTMAPTRPGIGSLATADLGDTPLRRADIVPPDDGQTAPDPRYDRTTLWYDAFWDAGRITMVAPPLLNLRKALRHAEIRVDGTPARPRFRTRRARHEILDLPAPRQASRIEIEGSDWRIETGISQANRAAFAGRNVIVTISRDNDLDWIGDFARYHRKTQCAEAILFIDNGSTRYRPDEIADVLGAAGLGGLVVPAPLPYGPMLKHGAHRHAAKFLRTSMLNLARLRFLATARAVLNIDIDELVWSEGQSVFDMAVRNPLGIAAFDGWWRLPGQADTPPLRHGDHVWHNDQDRPCPLKYAVAPGRPAGQMNWDVHRVGPPALRRFWLRKDAGYWHCAGINTGWKYTERLDRVGAHRDARMAAQIAAALGP
ncbi:MAG: hypothetical protein ACP5EN_02165 [Rhodovulum sp.]